MNTRNDLVKLARLVFVSLCNFSLRNDASHAIDHRDDQRYLLELILLCQNYSRPVNQVENYVRREANSGQRKGVVAYLVVNEAPTHPRVHMN